MRPLLLALSALFIATPAVAAPDARYVTCRKDADGGHLIAGLDAAGGTVYTIGLPGRGHAGAMHPAGTECVIFARRSGVFGDVLDPRRGALRRKLRAPEGRHYYGHGTYSAYGRLLFATENAYETGDGVLGI